MKAVIEQFPIQNPALEAPKVDGLEDDPLLQCLVALSRYYGVPRSAAALRAGLPIATGNLKPYLFVQSAERIGLSAAMKQRKFIDIDRLSLPCVLLLKDNSACVLLRLIGPDRAEVITPDNVEGSHEIRRQDLQERYAGTTIVVRSKIRLDARSEDLAPSRAKSWFWSNVFSFTPIYLEVILAALLINCFGVASPVFTMIVYDRVVPNQAHDTLNVLAIGISLTFFFDFLLRTMRGYFLDRVGKNLDRKLSTRIFEHLLSIKMAASPMSAGAFANNIREFETLRDFFTSASMTALVDLPFLLLFMLVIFLLGGPVVWVPAVMVPLVIIVSIIAQIPMRAAVERGYREASQKHSMLVETINGLDAIKVASAEGRRQRDWNHYVAAAASSSMASKFWASISLNFTVMAANLASIGVVFWGVYRTGEGLMTTGTMVAVSMLTSRAMAPLGQIASLIVRFHQSWTSLKGLNRLMALPSERPIGKEFLRRPYVQGAIEFRNVSFAYPGSKIAALHGVSFKINPGEKVGIIGRIGSGKTTIARMIVGLYEPTEGAVLIDGTDMRQIDPADLRHNQGCVLQDGGLFFGSVKDNITLGAPYVDEAAILKAASIAGVDQFVNVHPSGFDLQVGEGGRFLSGGQRQGIVIARSLLMDPPILVMDEPTSSMDNSTETAFRTRMNEFLSSGKTFVLVTHRHSMLALADRLLVVDGGKIVADGPKAAVLDALVKGRVTAAKP
jgi:ATP-binding cassette, subfamily C, bacterial LapB